MKTGLAPPPMFSLNAVSAQTCAPSLPTYALAPLAGTTTRGSAPRRGRLGGFALDSTLADVQ
jgi:hypothetical protein